MCYCKCMIDKDFLTIYEFCECLGIHYNTARKMIKSGRVSAIKMGVAGKTSDYRIPTSELQRLAVVDLGGMVDKIVEDRIKKKESGRKEIFLKNVKIKNLCWIWQAAKSKSGYGVFYYKDKWMRANRASHLIFKGEIPLGMLVCHSCDNPACVNPDHLHLGTPQDNMDEMKERGREKRQPKGEKAHMGKLKDSQVMEIREMRKQKIPAKQIAVKFNISPDYVYQISYGLYR